MDTKRRRTLCDGQGTVEYLGLVLVIGLLLAGAMIAIHRVRPPTHLPRVEPTGERVPLVGLLGTPAAPQPGWAARLVTRTRHVAVAAARGQEAFVAGFTRAAISDARDLVRDPVGTLFGRPGDGIGLITAVVHPIATGRAQVASLRRYLRDLRAMDPDDAWVRMMGDLGALGEDAVLSRGRRTLLKRAVRAGRQMRRNDPEITPPAAHN